MSKRKIKILVVDDSAFMRKAITRIIQSDESFKVVATARDGIEMLEMLPQVKPDVVTLDVEMPRMNGLEALREIHERYPSMPVIMVSSITKFGSEMSIRCLEAGAFEIVRKPESYVSMNISEISGDLISKLKGAANIKFNKTHRSSASPVPSKLSQNPKFAFPYKSQRSLNVPKTTGEKGITSQQVVTIGSSTGGPKALYKLLSKFPANVPAGFVIVQHMPPGNFIHSLTGRLNSHSQIEVRVAKEGDILEDGVALVGQIGKHIVFEKYNGTYKIHLTRLPKNKLHCPSIDVLFQSAGEVIGSNNISCILTGMGSDGTQGLKYVQENNGYVIAESEVSCIVYGMPRSAVESGYVNQSSHIARIPSMLLRLLYKDSLEVNKNQKVL